MPPVFAALANTMISEYKYSCGDVGLMLQCYVANSRATTMKPTVYPEVFVVKIPKGTTDRIDKAASIIETRSDLVRTAIVRELERREEGRQEQKAE